MTSPAGLSPALPASRYPDQPASRYPVRPAAAVQSLLTAARGGLLEAAGLDRAADRYATAHLAGLRAAAAVLAARARPSAPGPRRSRPTSAWVLLPAVAPELREWADFFAAGATKRAAAEAGLPGAASVREADDLVRAVEAFLAVVEVTLGRPHQPVLPQARTG